MKKKTLKKVAAVLTGMLLAVSLSACGSQGGSRNNASQARGEQQDAAPKTTQEAVVSPKETQTAQETQPETTQETQLPTEADTQLQTETVGGIFVDADNERAGNLAYRVQEGNAHDGNAALQYIYNGLIWLWAEEK